MKFKVTLTCPIPRVGFGTGDIHIEDEISLMNEYVSKADGDIVVFPEGFLKTENINKAEEIAKKYQKMIIVGSQDSGENQSLYTLVIDDKKGLIYSHLKTALTEGDRKIKCNRGDEISALDTKFGKIGTILCYEMHFPEISRIACIEGAQVLFNTIGTGMWHEQQFDEWTTIAKARAIENRCFTLGCTHYCDPIPMMYAYDPHGRCLLLERNYNGLKTVEIDLDLIDERDYFKDRNPKDYIKICKGEE